MAGNLIDLAEAAKMLGMSQERLTELVNANKIRSFRAGANVKFKAADVERYAEEHGSQSQSRDDDELSLAPDDSVGDNSILVSDELRGGGGGPTSTIIGANRNKVVADDSDLSLATSDSELNLGAGDSGLKPGSDVALVPDAMGSGVNLVAGDSDPSVKHPGSDFNLESDLVLGDSGAADDSLGGSDLALQGGSDLALQGSGLMLDSDGSGGSFDAGSGLSLADDDDDEDLVLGGSGIGSDLALGAGDSGINLKPTDSGLNLESEPMDLSGSAVGGLELPADDDMVSLDNLSGPDAATHLKDDGFLLTPIEDADDEDESGSQVIALEQDAYADQNAKTMLGGGFGGDPLGAPGPLVAEDADMFGAASQGPGGMAQPMHMPMPAPTYDAPQSPYTVWNVLSLAFIFFFLCLSGMLMMDLLRNMWTFDGNYDSSTFVMDSIVGALGLK